MNTNNEPGIGAYFNLVPFAMLALLIPITASSQGFYIPFLEIPAFLMCGVGAWLTTHRYRKGVQQGTVGIGHWFSLVLCISIIGFAMQFHLLFGMIVGAFALAVLAFSKDDGPSLEKEHLRGRKMSIADAVHIALQEELRQSDRPGIFFSGTDMAQYYATKHFLVVGTTGSGKSLTLSMMMRSILPFLGRGGGQRALLFDPKQELLPLLNSLELAVPVISLNPLDARSYAWDIAADITTPTEAEALADILIPVQKNDSSPFFRDSVANLMIGIVQYFIINAPGVWTLRDVLVAMESQEQIQKILSTDARFRKCLDVLGDPKTAANVRATLRSKINRYEVIAACWHHSKHRLSLRQWVNGQAILVLGHDFTNEPAMQAVNQVLFKRAAQILLQQRDTSEAQTFVIFDELPIAKKLEDMETLCTFGRSKGVSVTLAFQDIGSIWDIYGRERADTMLNQCNTRAYLRLAGEKTAKWISDTVGTREVRITSKQISTSESHSGISTSHSTNSHDTTEHVLLPGQLTSLPETNSRNGLTGYFDIRGMIFQHTIPWDVIERRIITADAGTARFISVPPQAQYLLPWDEHDLDRLNLRWLDRHSTAFDEHDDFDFDSELDTDTLLNEVGWDLGGEDDEEWSLSEFSYKPPTSSKEFNQSPASPVSTQPVLKRRKPIRSDASSFPRSKDPLHNSGNEKPRLKRRKRLKDGDF